MDPIPLKRLKYSNCDPLKCVICQRVTKQSTTSEENGRQKILRAASIRDDEVAERLKLFDHNTFVYHMSNDCYKKYTHGNILTTLDRKKNRVHQEEENTESTTEAVQRVTRSTSQATPRDAPVSSEINMYETKCVVRGCAKHCGTYQKYRICECKSADKFLKATIYFHDEVYVRICDLEDTDAVFGADILYHSDCIRKYIRRYERSIDTGSSIEVSRKVEIFTELLNEVHADLYDGKAISLSTIRNKCNSILENKSYDESLFSNREIKMLLLDHYGSDVCFSKPHEANKSTIVFLDSCSREDMVDQIQSMNP